MRTFKLTPINLDQADWQASSYNHPVIIVAADEDAARRRAADIFRSAASRKLGEDIPTPPWTRPELVVCKVLDFADDEGPERVLAPGWAELEFPNKG